MDNAAAANQGWTKEKKKMDRIHPLDVLIGAFALIDILIITVFIRILLQ